MTPLNDKLIAVEVPENIKEFEIYTNKAKDCIRITYWYGDDKLDYSDKDYLPDGSYSILGICNNKEVGFYCEDLVESTTFVRHHVSEYESHYSKYMNYLTGKPEKDNAADSFRSLLQSKSLDLDKCYLIITKI